jgi:hypothetical protein
MVAMVAVLALVGACIVWLVLRAIGPRRRRSLPYQTQKQRERVVVAVENGVKPNQVKVY